MPFLCDLVSLTKLDEREKGAFTVKEKAYLRINMVTLVSAFMQIYIN